MADYFRHWLEIGRRPEVRLPRIFYVNWFRRDAEDGRFLWPGFGDNARVLAWIFRRCDDATEAVDTPVGRVPSPGALETEGLEISAEDLEAAVRVDPEEWREELGPVRAFFDAFGDRLPAELRAQLEAAERRLGAV